MAHRRPAARQMRLASLGTKAGTGYAVHRARRVFAAAERRDELDRRFEINTAEQVAQTLADMKGLLMKVGQMASFMSDDLPEAFRVALAQLQQDGPTMSPELAASVVAAELGQPPERVFAEWDPVPIAAASIGQVHRAITRDGLAVAVKVQYPGVDEAIGADLQNAELLYRVMGMVFKGLDPAPLAEELAERFTEELDYRKEAANQREFAAVFAGHPFIHIPAVVDRYSTARVLTTELASGARLDELVHWSQAERNMAGEAVFRFSGRSLEQHRLLNGDAHPGNYLFRPGGRVSFLDFGLVKRVSHSEQGQRHALLAAMHAGDATAYRRTLEETGVLRVGAPFSDERVLDYFRGNIPRPVALDEEFTFTSEYTASVLRQFFDPGGPDKDVKQWHNMAAPSFLILGRRNFGVNAVLARLEATANWHRIAGEIWPWVNGPPSTPLGREEAAWLASTGAVAESVR